MKTIQSSLLIILFLSLTVYITLNADDMKCGVGKCGSAMKVPNINIKNTKDKSEKKDTKEKINKVDTQNEWRVLQPKEEHQRGTIQTH